MSGLEFLHSIRQDPEFESMAVYVLTSSDLPQDLESARSYNVVSYVVKPFTPEKYREVIQALVASWDEQSFETID
jgi:CheY-like chemotaxis protein